jgi:hypothetical protein
MYRAAFGHEGQVMTWRARNTRWLAAAERWYPQRVEPLRICIQIADQIAWDDLNGMHCLEGALQWVVVARETGRVPSDVFRGCDERVNIPIPLTDVEIAGRTIACCSWARPALRVSDVRWIRKRADIEALRLNQVRINGGEHKSTQVPVATLATPFIDFFVRGDRDLLADLMTDIVSLGRARGAGLGVVHRWGIAEDHEDRSLVWRGQPQRMIPIVMDGGIYDVRSYEPGSFVERMSTTRAPYWVMHDPSDEVLCAAPVVRSYAEELAA